MSVIQPDNAHALANELTLHIEVLVSSISRVDGDRQNDALRRNGCIKSRKHRRDREVRCITIPVRSFPLRCIFIIDCCLKLSIPYNAVVDCRIS